MAASLQQRIDSVKSKAQLLMERFAELLEEKQAAEAQIAELHARLQLQQREIDRMKVEIENLKVVTVLTPRREDVEKSRAFLSQLVRDIDKCIAELNE